MFKFYFKTASFLPGNFHMQQCKNAGQRRPLLSGQLQVTAGDCCVHGSACPAVTSRWSEARGGRDTRRGGGADVTGPGIIQV